MKSAFFSDLSHLWSIHKERRTKVLLLGLVFFFLSACQAIWRPLKTSIFAKIVGAHEVASAKLYVLFYIVPLLIFYSYLVDKLKRHQLLYVFSLFHSAIGLIFFGILSYWPITEIHNSPSLKVFGWVFYFFMESFSAFLSTCFWSFANSVSTPQDAQDSYGFIVLGSKMGGIISAGLLYISLNFLSGTSTQVLPNSLLAGCLLLIASVIAVRLLIKHVPDAQMQGYKSETEEQEDIQVLSSKRGMWSGIMSILEGLLSIIKYPYVAGITSLVLLYEIMIVILDYRILLTADAAYSSAEALTQYYALQYMCMHAIGLFFVLFGTVPLQRLSNIRLALFAFPVVSSLLVSATYFWPTPTCFFITVVLVRALNYAVNHPTRETLYIPTTKAIRYKAKAWTDAFGSRAAKATGSFFNLLTTPYGAEVISQLSAVVNAAIIGTWLCIASALGVAFVRTIEEKKLIGETPREPKS